MRSPGVTFIDIEIELFLPKMYKKNPTGECVTSNAPVLNRKRQRIKQAL